MRRQALHSYLPLIAGLLLAIYGAAGVLGYGLHSILGCGHCHEGACQSLAEAPSAIAFTDDRLELRSLEPAFHVPTDQRQLVLTQEDCPICAFLVQAQSQFVFHVASECVDVVPTIPPAIFSSYDSPLLGTHPGRGPPTC